MSSRSALVALLLFVQLAPSFAHAAMPSTECQNAFAELKQYIDQQQGYLSQGQLETSVAADTIRLACDGSPDAYQKSIRDIAAQYAPPPPAATDQANTSGSYSMSEQTENVLTILMFIALIAASSAGVFSFGSAGGSGGVIITPH